MKYTPAEVTLLAGALVALIVVTLVGNALVAAAVIAVRKLRHPPNFLLVSLALADFCVGFIVLPFSGYQLVTGEWPLGITFCRIWASFDVLLCTASILNLCAVSVDRYFAITKPLIYGPKRTTKRILGYILTVWVVAFCISVVPVIALPPAFKVTNQTSIGCEPNQNIGYQVYATLCAFYIPVAIMLLVNYKIYKSARRLAYRDQKSREESTVDAGAAPRYSDSPTPKFTKQDSCRSVSSVCNGATTAERRKALLRRIAEKAVDFLPDSVVQNKAVVHESRAARTLSIIMGAFIVCWLPFFVVALAKPIVATLHPTWVSAVPVWLDLTVLWLGYLNSAINPGLYAMFNRDFRVPFREMLCCRCRNLSSVMRSETFIQIYGSKEPRPLIVAHDTAETPIDNGPHTLLSPDTVVSEAQPLETVHEHR